MVGDFMKDNKVIVELLVPSIGEKFSIFIPVNKTIGEVIVILNKTINDIYKEFPILNNLSLFDVIDSKIYDMSSDVKTSGIKNGTILALI